MEIHIYQVDAFTSQPFGGNPAGVVPNAKDLSEVEMQQIANEMNLSETAFVIPLYDDLFKVRFFTPLCEVDLCGHATIATFYTLASKGYIKPIENGTKTVYQQTKVGRLPVEIKFIDNTVDSVIMEQAIPKPLGNVELLEPLLDSMSINKSQIGVGDKYIEPMIISTGLPDIILPIKNKEVLDNLKIDFCKMAEICDQLKVTGVHAFYLPTINSSEVYTRNFGPSVGINEESATGTANGALMYFLNSTKLSNQRFITSFQGESLKRPSEIQCYINEDNGRIRIKVGGKAKIVIDGIISF